MGPPRLALLLLVAGTAAAAGERPAAVQVCFSLPDGIPLFAPTARANYRSLDAEAQVLDLDLRLNGQRPERLTRNGPGCVRAWLPAVRVSSLSVSFERTALGLAAQERRVDLKLQPDLWYDGGSFTVAREPWARFTSAVPGQVTLERLSEAGAAVISDHQRVPGGTYRIRYQPPPPDAGPCRFTLRATGVGTIRPDNRPELFARLVEQYRSEWLPEVASAQKLTCEPAEAMEAAVRIVDGAFLDPLRPALHKVRVAEREPRYALRVDGAARPFEDGQTVVVAPGQALVLELAAETVASAAP